MTTITIHGVRCYVQGAADSYAIVRVDTGAVLAQAARRFLAIARAAVLLHTPVAHSAHRDRREYARPRAFRAFESRPRAES